MFSGGIEVEHWLKMGYMIFFHEDRHSRKKKPAQNIMLTPVFQKLNIFYNNFLERSF